MEVGSICHLRKENVMKFTSDRMMRVFGLAMAFLATFSLGLLAAPPADNPVNVTLSEYKIDMPSSLPAGPTTFHITNSGSKKHTFRIEGNGIEEKLKSSLKEKESGTLQLDLKPGTYKVTCPVIGHTHKGMSMELKVTQ
jgi:plastocyanin